MKVKTYYAGIGHSYLRLLPFWPAKRNLERPTAFKVIKQSDVEKLIEAAAKAAHFTS